MLQCTRASDNEHRRLALFLDICSGLTLTTSRHLIAVALCTSFTKYLQSDDFKRFQFLGCNSFSVCIVSTNSPLVVENEAVDSGQHGATPPTLL